MNILKLANIFYKLAQSAEIEPTSDVIQDNSTVPNAPKRSGDGYGIFNWEDFSTLDSIDECVDYLEENPLNYIAGGKGEGLGSGRAVLDLEQDKVLKVAWNDNGNYQNIQEARIQNRTDIFAKVFDMHPKGFWLISEKIIPFQGADEFIRETGLSPGHINIAFRRGVKDPEGLQRMKQQFSLSDQALELLEKIVLNRAAFDLLHDDMKDPTHWGVSIIDGKVKLFDYGAESRVFHAEPERFNPDYINPKVPRPVEPLI